MFSSETEVFLIVFHHLNTIPKRLSSLHQGDDLTSLYPEAPENASDVALIKPVASCQLQ